MSRHRSTSITVDDNRRWDRERFETYRSRAPPSEREEFRFSERDYERGAPSPRRSIVLDERIETRGGPRGRFEEEIRIHEEDRYNPSRRRMSFMEEPIPAEVANRALAPYRRREYDAPAPPRPARPQYLRRQSSLDTFDRKPLPRYADEYRIPPRVSIPLPIRRPKHRDEYDEMSYRELPNHEREVDEYRDIRIRRERGGGREASRAPTASQRSSSSSSFEEITTVQETVKIGKKGKTRMPKRLVHKKAIVDLGLPFEEEDDFIIVQRALTKEHIDDIIEKSKTYKEEKTVYKYVSDREGTTKEEIREEKSVKAESRHESSSSSSDDEEIITKKTTIIEGAPRAPSPARTEKSHRSHRSHRSHHTSAPPPPPMSVRDDAGTVREDHFREEIVEQSNPIGGPLTVLAPQDRHASDSEIRREIRSLEAERRALKYEREADMLRHRGSGEDYEFIERVDRYEEDHPSRARRSRSKSVVRVEKDRKVYRSKSRARAPNPKLVALAMGALT